MVGYFKMESSLLGKRCNFSLLPFLATSELPYQELGATVLQNRCPTGPWKPLGPQISQEGCTTRAVVSVGLCQSMDPNRDIRECSVCAQNRAGVRGPTARVVLGSFQEVSMPE